MILGRIFAATLLGTSLLVAGAAQADPRHCPPGHAKKGWCESSSQRHNPYDDRWGGDERDSRSDNWRHHRNDDWRARRDDDDWRRDRRDDDWRDRWEDAQDRAYEEGYRAGRHDAWQRGDRLPRDRYRVVPDYYSYGWPAPADGQFYAEADGGYYLMNMATGMILDVLSR